MAETPANISSSKGSTAEKEVEMGPNLGLGKNLLAFTINADSGEIVKIEKVDEAGSRRDLRDDETIALTAKAAPTVDTLIEQAFEAGIACMLGPAGRDDAEDPGEESDDEADLRRELLLPLMENSSARGLLMRDVLGRAILASAIAQIAAARTAKSGERGGTQPKGEGGSRKPH